MEVLRPCVDELLRLRETSRDLVEIVPGKAVASWAGCSDDVVGDESVNELVALSGGVGGPLVATRRGPGGATFGPDGVYSGVSYGAGYADIGAVRELV